MLCLIGGDQKLHLDDINLDKNYTPSGAYGRSKLANILFTVELAKRLNGNFFLKLKKKNLNFVFVNNIIFYVVCLSFSEVIAMRSCLSLN